MNQKRETMKSIHLSETKNNYANVVCCWLKWKWNVCTNFVELTVMVEEVKKWQMIIIYNNLMTKRSFNWERIYLWVNVMAINPNHKQYITIVYNLIVFFYDAAFAKFSYQKIFHFISIHLPPGRNIVYCILYVHVLFISSKDQHQQTVNFIQLHTAYTTDCVNVRTRTVYVAQLSTEPYG